MNAIDRIYESVKARDPDQPEFHQAVLEVLESLGPVLLLFKTVTSCDSLNNLLTNFFPTNLFPPITKTFIK